jgi:23S rRNA (guanosine2251-2'-O)-methyltransferase
MHIPGRNPTIEALRSAHKVQTIYMEQDMNQDAKITEILNLAKSKNTLIKEVSRKELDKLAEGENHQGVVAEARNVEALKFSEQVLIDKPGFYIYIREALYEHNVGAIIRTAEAAGIAGVILAPKQELTATIGRMSMGAVFHIPIYSGSLFPTIKMFREAGMTISGIETNGGVNLFESHLDGDGLLIVGGEDRALSTEVAEKCDQLIYIPQFGKINSLNMSVAAAIAMYEHVRQSA